MISLDEIKDQIVVRVIASEWHYGKWQYAFDDPVLLSMVDKHIKDLIAIGIKRITIHVVGKYSEVHDMDWQPMRGTDQLNKIRKNTRLEDFYV